MLKEKIKNDLSKALKESNQTALSTLRLLLAAVSNREIDKKYREKIKGEAELTDDEIIGAISSEIKKRKESAMEFEKGGRKELAEKELAEAKILQVYLPEQFSEEEIEKLAKEAVGKIKASSVKDMGKVMAELAPKIKGKADGAQVSQIVKKLLS